MALAGELGSRPLVARCHLGLGQLQLRTMDMGHWLAQTEAELAAQG